MTTYYMRTKHDAAHLPAPVQEGDRPGMTACGLLLFSDAVPVSGAQVLVYLEDNVCIQCEPRHVKALHSHRYDRPGWPNRPSHARDAVLRWAS